MADMTWSSDTVRAQALSTVDADGAASTAAPA